MLPFRITGYLLLILAIYCAGAKAEDMSRQDFGLTEKPGAMLPENVYLLNEDSIEFPLRALIHKPTLLVFVYYHCPSQCPLLLEGLAEVVNFSKAIPGTDYQIVTVSIDASETPAQAAAVRDSCLAKLMNSSDPYFWRFFTADSLNIRKLCHAVGYEFRTDGENFVHTTSTVMLTPSGKVSQYFYGTYFNAMHFEMSVDKASRELVVPTRLKTLKYCYNYKPAENRLLQRITVIYGIGILGVIFLLFLFLALKNKRRSDGKDG